MYKLFESIFRAMKIVFNSSQIYYLLYSYIVHTNTKTGINYLKIKPRIDVTPQY